MKATISPIHYKFSCRSYYVIECVSPWVFQSSDCVRNIYWLYFGYRIYTILNPKKLYHVDDSHRLISISSDPFSSTLVNDRLLIDWNIPATMFSFHVESTVCDYSKRIYLQCSCYFDLVTTHSIHLTMCTMFSRKDFLYNVWRSAQNFHQKNQHWT